MSINKNGVNHGRSVTSKRSGIEDDDKPEPCRHPEHNPPTHLYIPAGKRYRHICPGCGQEAIISSTFTH